MSVEVPGSHLSGVRILRIQIANGYHSEARLDAALFGGRPQEDRLLTFYHQWPEGDHSAASAYARDARSEIRYFDAGWRPSQHVRRSIVPESLFMLQLARVTAQMTAHARRWKPDVIDSSQQKIDCTLASMLSWTLRKPQIIHLWYPIGPWLGRFPNSRLRNCTHVIVPSEYMRHNAIEHGVRSHRITTLPGTLRLPKLAAPGTRDAVLAGLGIPADSIVMGIFARLEEWKGQRDTIAAFDRIAVEHPSTHLLIAGQGPARAALEAQASRSTARERIHFLGFRTDIPSLLAGVDVFCHPSRDEAFGRSVLEAAANAIPVIAYQDGASPEIVIHGETGLLAPIDDIDALARFADNLIRDGELRRRMGQAGRRRVELNFNPVRTAVRFSAVARQVGVSGQMLRRVSRESEERRPSHQ